MGDILVLNAGSSSIKAALFDTDLNELSRATVDEIETSGAGHRGALEDIFRQFSDDGRSLDRLSIAGHRVVHGGDFAEPAARVDARIRDIIQDAVPLAPLHNPHNLAGIDALLALAPDLTQIACFDTAFHASNPEVARRYGVSADLDRKGYRRYGFHGISYAGLTEQVRAMSGGVLPGRLLAFHLGNGASLCAIRDGRSVATSMGYSPVSGLTMGTRPGDMDANAVLDLADAAGIEHARQILNRESGLLALGGHSDMRALHAAETPDAAFAINHFCYWAARQAGSMIAAMGGCDAIAFTGGIGENDAMVRGQILSHLSWLGSPAGKDAVLIVPAREERTIARLTRDAIG